MSVKAITWAFDRPVSATEKVVLLALADHADEHGMCWPSISLLVKRAHVGERTVQRALQSLEDGGFIARERRQRENGSDTSNLYLLNMDGSQRKPTDTSVTKGGVNLAPHAVHGGVIQTGGEGVTQTGGEGGLHDTPRTIIKNRNIEPPSISADAEFAAFWAAYPKRPNNPKQPAIRKYVHARQVLKVSHETLVNGAKAYAASRAGEDPRYTAQAVTWLNQRRWDDEYVSPAEAKKPEPLADEEDFKLIKDAFPGTVGDENRAKANLAAELVKGTALSEIVMAAKKYALYIKQMRQKSMDIAASTLDAWLKFKWREMDAYYIYRNPADPYPVLKAKKDKDK